MEKKNNNYLIELAYSKITIYDLSNRKTHYRIIEKKQTKICLALFLLAINFYMNAHIIIFLYLIYLMEYKF